MIRRPAPARRPTLRRVLLTLWVGQSLLWSMGSGSEETTELLRDAIDQWSHERDAWAFTQRVREYDDDGRSRTRTERFDPSKGDTERWTLVSMDGRAPTEDEVASFLRRKGTKRDRRTKAPSEYVDFERVIVLADQADSVQYAVPLRDDISRLIPLEQLTVIITVDRSHRSIQQLAINLDDPIRIALGLARVTDLNFDLRFEPADVVPGVSTPMLPPTGVAEASVSKFGKRAEFSWSEFTRVRPPGATLDSDRSAATASQPD